MMKGYDEGSHGLTYVLEGTWGSVTDHSSDFGCRFGFNSFLDYGAELMCLELSPIREVWALSGLAERKTADADWKSAFSEAQVFLYNSSTRLVSNDKFEATILKGDVTKSDLKASKDQNSFCVQTSTELCPHVKGNRPKRVSMIPLVNSRATSSPFQKDSLSLYAAKDHTCVGPPLSRDWVEIRQDAASGLITPSSPPCPEKLCLASLPCDEKMRPIEKNLDVVASRATLTDLILPESHIGIGNKSFLFESAPSTKNLFICKQGNLIASPKKSFDDVDKEIEMVGKALCYAQTRARLAEKLAEQALKERDKLEQLLIRETWTSYSYRQRAITLEVENRLLKSHSKQGSQLWSNKKKSHLCESVEPSPFFIAGEKHSPSPNSRGSYRCSSKHGKKSNSREGVSLSCALGFAFVLGLSIAGAGIVIVWTFSCLLYL